MGKQFKPWNVDQQMLLPPTLKDFVPEGHLAHFVRELVRKELDLREIESSYSQLRGAPPYPPKMMTAILLYAYSRSLYSSRKIALACEERLDFKAVAGMEGPDFRTIASFRRRHYRALQKLFLQVLDLCAKAGLVKLGHVAIDGTKIAANASIQKNKRYDRLCQEERGLEQVVKGWLDAAEAADAEEDELYGEDKRGDEQPEWMKDPQERLKRIREAKQALEEQDRQEREKRKQDEKQGKKGRSGEKEREEPKANRSINSTDPDSRVMKAGPRFIQGYNAQAAVDSDSQLIVAADVVCCASDQGELIPMVDLVKKNCKRKPKEISADTTYCTELNLKALEQRGIRGYVALGSSSPGESARALVPGSFRQRMSERLKKGGRRSRYRIRSKTVEPVFGIIKHARGFRQFLLRGLELIRTEFLLVATAHNMLKLRKAYLAVAS